MNVHIYHIVKIVIKYLNSSGKRGASKRKRPQGIWKERIKKNNYLIDIKNICKKK